MNELPLAIKRSIGKYEPINTEGFTLYPIQVSRYPEFLIARDAIAFVQQELPVELMGRPLLEALFKLDMGGVEGYAPTGLFTGTLLALALALRLKTDGSIEELVNEFGIVVNPEDPTQLKCLRYCVNGEEVQSITPIQYSRLRTIIAAQNGVELVDENANPELLRAERDLALKNMPNLDISIEQMISSASLITGEDEGNIYDWAILKLDKRLEAAKRVLDYVICGVGESQGTKWKGGNPCPHPWFAKLKNDSGALISMETFYGGQGLQAMRNAGAFDDNDA